MGILNRVSVLFHAKVMGVVDRAEDPRETLPMPASGRRNCSPMSGAPWSR